MMRENSLTILFNTVFIQLFILFNTVFDSINYSF